MRVLIDPAVRPRFDDLTDDKLAVHYAPPSTTWLRANMVATVDGAATGANGLTGTINNPIDKRVFQLLRRMADAIVVGAGTARAERYGPAVRPLVLVSRVGVVPAALSDAEPGSVLMATCEAAEGLEATRGSLGDDNVLVLGDDTVDLALLVDRLAERGMANLLCEGGPRLLDGLLAASLVDELCFTQVPALVGGQQSRITLGAPVEVPLELALLIESEGTLVGRWLTERSGQGATPATGPV